MNGELPKGWIWTSLGNIIKIQGGYAFKSKDYQKEGIPLLRITNIANGKIIFNGKENVYLPNDYILPLDSYIVKKNDILIALSGVNTGKTGIYELEYPSLLNQRVGRVQLLDKLSSNKFILYYLEYIREEVLKKTYGAAQPNISTLQLENMGIPLPPLAEQQRIVNKIEELFTNLDKGVESLEEVKSKLKVYRQAILKYAMEGKLTEKWREENKGNIESELSELRKITEEKQNILNEVMSNGLNDDNFPPSWIRLRLIDLASYINPGFPCGRHNKECKGIIHIRPMNIDKEGRISLVNIKYVEIYNYDSLMKGDILFNNTNSSELVGKTTYIESDTNWAYSNHMTRIRIKNPMINNKWISTYLHFLFNCGYFGKICVHHVNQSSVGSKYLSEKILIPIPSLSEQNLIIQYIEQYFSLIDKNYEVITYQLEQSKVLRQSILKKAFEGKLVPQDQNDEPAEILLERIKMEKSNKGKSIQEKLIQ